MAQQFKDKTKDEDDENDPLDYQIPDTKSISSRLEEASKSELRREHIQLMDEEEKEEKKTGKKKANRQRQGGTICCCEDPNCRIGPFIEKQIGNLCSDSM